MATRKRFSRYSRARDEEVDGAQELADYVDRLGPEALDYLFDLLLEKLGSEPDDPDDDRDAQGEDRRRRRRARDEDPDIGADPFEEERRTPARAFDSAPRRRGFDSFRIRWPEAARIKTL